MRQTKEPQDWHEVAYLLGKAPIRMPRPIRVEVNTAALARIREQIRRDREAGLLPPQHESTDA